MNNIALIENKTKINSLFPHFLLDNNKPCDPPTKNPPSLSCISEEALNFLTEKAKTVNYPKHTIIIAEDNKSNSFFIILSGKVRIFSSANNKEVTHSIQGAGTYFGETVLLTNEPLLASVITLEKTVCAVVVKNDFLNWLTTYPEATFAFLSVLSGMIRRLTDKVRQLALLNVYQRTIQTLRDMAIDNGNVSVIHDRPTQQELAFMVGASREMVSKIMLDLTKGGYVKIHDNNMIINKKIPSYW